MQIDLSGKPQTSRLEIHGTDLVLILRRPTYAERLREFVGDNSGDYMRNRLQSVIGWENVVDQDGNPLAFNANTFAVACEQVDGLFEAACDEVLKLYRPKPTPPTVDGSDPTSSPTGE